MRTQLRQLSSKVGEALNGDRDRSETTLMPLRAAAAQLLIATAVEVALEHFGGSRSTDDRAAPRALTWAPALIGPLTAAAHLEHARRPRDESSSALRILNGATLAVGGALLVYDLVEPSDGRARRLGALSFASAGLLGLIIESHESSMRRNEDQLKRRARLVERFVPKRKAHLDHVVVHV